ncbi:hypothetical protein [Paenirhodobacter sp. CAU 1674]|uniref:hypothetical protein n=1 Tax=Paenirhodobacter sp. CAU 1674 TaxID=3032596 RepID=UPI0023DCA485|nr:hypothetical protein [Paenirhodobacter sp. CAU 1674]MDF2142256.1 hypothetical protein [Paenirhodobacter sp. CAU 1674]
MDRRGFLCAGAMLALIGAGAAPAFAGGAEDSVMRQLKAQGYSQIQVQRTWLGRLRITAQRGKVQREIVLDPRTGELLRDLSTSGATLLRSPSDSGADRRDSGSSGAANDDSDDDDDDDDDEGGGSDDGGGGEGGNDDD